MGTNQKYVALLRGINVGGHHKVPMAELRQLLEDMGFSEVNTLLNSGNVVFESEPAAEKFLEEKIATKLEQTFGFPVPVLIRPSDSMQEILSAEPFAGVEVTKDIRQYVTFLLEPPEEEVKLDIPWTSEDGAFTIISTTDREIFGVLDLSRGRTTDAMSILGETYGNDMTTRNWNTILRIGKLL